MGVFFMVFRNGYESGRSARLIRCFMLACVLCAVFGMTVPAAGQKLRLNKNAVVLYAGIDGSGSFQLKVNGNAVSAGGTMAFESSAPEVASVSQDGTITALKRGTAVIKVTDGVNSASCQVTVKRAKLWILTGRKVALGKGDRYRIKVRTNPAGAKVTYTSSDKKVAGVNRSGRIRAKSEGTAVITVACGTRSKKITVTVSAESKPKIETLTWNSSWKYASYSKIHTGSVKLYRAVNSRGITVAVNAGHGTSGGSSVYTQCHPDGSPKVTGGSTEAGATSATAISSGTVLLDGTSEASANLSLAKLLKQELLSDGYDVLMIREDSDVQLDNIARTVFANRYADCHISLHYDSTTSDKGAYVMTVPDVASYRAMEPVASTWKETNRLGTSLISGLKKEGVKIHGSGSFPMDLTQTSYSTVPSIDIEVGDRASSHGTSTQTAIAKGIAKGVTIFFKK